jgi:cardiolipin synthase
MLRAIKNAKDHINVESYIFEDEDQGKHFAELLINKQAEGVQVNIIYDSIGSRRTSSSFFKSLESAGVAILEFNRIGARNIRNPGSIMHRNHRKMLIVDGRIAFTGGMNISDVYLPSFGNPRGKARPWRDTQVKIEGPAVETFQRLFLDTWMREGQPPAAANYYPELTSKGNALVRVIGSRPGETNRLNYLMYLSAVTHATRSIYLTVSYFAPDENLLEALERSVERGVDVKIVLPGKTDIPFVLRAGQAHYKRLLEAGVKLYQRQGSILHAKTAVVDGVWSKVGSTNLEFWSLLRSNEVDAIILDPEFGKAMEKVFNWDLKYSDEITLDKWQQRPMSDRIKEWCARLITYWL